MSLLQQKNRMELQTFSYENLISLTMSALVTYELSVLVRDAIDMTGMEIFENIFAISLP